ncbi:MAG: T9SS type A sorting domain-containing protein [Bacteroidia bacterium]
MKKIYLSLLGLAVLTTANAQKPTNVQVGESATYVRTLESNNGPEFIFKTSANTVVTDTNWYFFNKHAYRNTPANANLFPTFKNAPTYTASNAINAGGSVFNNTGGNVVVSGIEALVMRQASSPSTPVQVELSLWNVTSGLPTGNAVASCTTGVSTSTAGVFVGCNFAAPAIVVGDFAVVIRNVSTNNQDTIRMFMNNARTSTSSATPAEKYGEGMGILGVGPTFGSTWAKTTNVFNGASYGSDFEFVLAPRVTYTFTADHNPNPAITAPICNTTQITYVNTTTSFANHRQWNLNKFAKAWAPFSNTLTITADSVYTWNFGDGVTLYDESPTHTYVVASSGPVNDNLAVKIQKMSDYSSPNTQLDVKAWTVTITICNVGLTENNLETQFELYPNPANEQVTVYVNDANANTSISVLNALGQVVLTENRVSDKNVINTESLAKGVYFVKVSDGTRSSTTKLIISK